MGEIKIRKPNVPKWWGFMRAVSRYTTQRNKWLELLPKVVDKIKLTWLPVNNAKGNPNCYIGITGIVDVVHDDGSIILTSINEGNGVLIVGKNYNYEQIV